MTYRKPVRIFEKSGLVNPAASYHVHLDNVVNADKQDIKTMVDLGRYFSIFAPRQSGKTTFLDGMRKILHEDETYVSIILSFQKYKDLTGEQFYASVEKELYGQLIARLKEVKCDKSETVEEFLKSHRLTGHLSFNVLLEELNRIIQFKKIMIFIDEFDGIPLTELENFLHVLRDLYQKYKGVTQKALYSVGLVGVRNITKLIVGGVSPFNIADQVKLPPFSLNNARDLFAQYTEETNQSFNEEAVKKIHRATAGQPWLVNRLGTILTMDIKPETIEPINVSDVDAAIRLLLKERNTHFDNLYEKVKLYKETFVKIVFNNVNYNPDDEDQTWLEQYGLITGKDFKAVVANSIYRQRYLETLFNDENVPEAVSPSDYVLPGHRLDMERALLDFEQYIAQIGVRAFYKDKKPYEKTGQFLLTAWLYQFVKSGGGDLRYEIPTGLGRMDILLNYKGRKYIIETKINRRNLSRTIEDGIGQLARKYLATEAAQEGYLVVFDTLTAAGKASDPQIHVENGMKVSSLVIAIGRED